MKKPFPVSIDEELAMWIISNSKRYRNRSHLVEEAIKDFRKRFEGKHGKEIGESLTEENIRLKKALRGEK